MNQNDEMNTTLTDMASDNSSLAPVQPGGAQ